tara:strand:- start:860 stop:2236 length:1377 start_codon:yes stop_codon:yes gene_type:complete
MIRIIKLLTFISAVLGHTFTKCGTNIMGIQEINLLPDPPQINANLTVNIKGQSINILNDPKILLEVSVMNIPVYNLDIDICKYNSCPIQKNKPYSLNFSYFIPNEKFHDIDADVKLNINDNSKAIACIDVQTHLNLYSSLPTKLNNILNRISLYNTIEELFKKWIEHYNKKYTPNDYKTKFNIFYDNTKYILSHTDKQYNLGHNHLSDLNRDEYRKLLGYKQHTKLNIINSEYKLDNIKNIPESIDWRSKGAVTPVKNQGQCGSCWSFSTTGALEGAYFIKTGKLVSFSEQELVSCDTVDQGCNGGLMDNAFEWIHNSSGLCSEESYPYDSGNGNKLSCSTKCLPVKNSKVKSYIDVKQDTKSLTIALSKQPVAIAIEADHLSFQFYRSGVYRSDCGNKLDHGVLAVGYGTMDNVDYWIVKNSWSEKWGDNGYILLEKGKTTDGGECGILLSASYPVL